MEVTGLGLVFIALFAVSAAWRRGRLLHVLAATAAFPTSAAIIVAGMPVSPFHVGLLVYLVTASFGAGRRAPRSVRNMSIALGAYAVLITALGPILFRGYPVIASDVGLDMQAHGNLSVLSFSISNLAQAGYLLLNLALVITFAKYGEMSQRHVATIFVVGFVVALSAHIASLAGVSWPHELFDNSERRYFSIETGRLRGQFAEPSHLGAFSVAGLMFFAARAVEARASRTASIVGSLVGILLLWAADATTSNVGLVVAVVWLLSMAVGSVLLKGRTAIVHPLGFVVGLWTILLVPFGVMFAVSQAAGRVGHMSFVNRTYSDFHALRLLADSGFFGVGLGSNRSSSLVTLLLSTIGIAGTAMFGALVIRVLKQGFAQRRFASAVSLIAILSAGAVSFADFANPTMWLLIGCCGSACIPLRSRGSRECQQEKARGRVQTHRYRHAPISA